MSHFINHIKVDEDNLKVKDLPNKKTHEISRMANLVADVCDKVNVRNVIDVGAGKGYLSTFLSAEYGLDVTAIDCVTKNLEQIENRCRLMNKYYFHRVNQEEGTKIENKRNITVKCVADTVRPSWLPGIEPEKQYVLVGLHCCGDLSSVLSKLAVELDQIVAMVLVPCCYHHLTEQIDLTEAPQPNMRSQFETGLARGLDHQNISNSTKEIEEIPFIGFPLSRRLAKCVLGRNTRMLACHSRERTQAEFHLDKDLKSES